jgi:alpha-L-fucosidase
MNKKHLSVLALAAAMAWGSFAGAQTSQPALSQVQARTLAAGGNDTGFDMAPETRLEVVQAAVDAIPAKLPEGPFKPTWESLQQNYKVPQWFYDAKFGIFMHWGLYSVPAYHNEWYEQHMYNGFIQWHTQHFGSIDKFGYKDFIPLFTAEKWDPNAWAELFKKAGAKFVVPTAQHHDNFALWDSQVTPWNAKQMGPKRDLIGDLSKAVRAQGLKFGVSNHGIENFQFIHPDASAASRALMADLKAKQADVYDPKWADFYNVADRSDEACKKFLVNWAMRNTELIDKYQVDMLWFDNGVDQRYLDPIKLWVATYYYNRAKEWNKEVSISTKKAAYAPSGTNLQTIGSIIDFEKIGARSPAGIRGGAWQVDHPIGSTWGYTSDMTVSSPASIVNALVDTASKNGILLLNISPKPDGTIPDAQQNTLLELGKWLQTNGEAIYSTHAWIKFGEGGGRGSTAPNVRYTVKDQTLYATILGNYPTAEITIASLPTGAAEGTISSISLLGSNGKVDYSQDASGLKVKLPAEAPGKYGYVLKISGLKMNPTLNTPDGNPKL